MALLYKLYGYTLCPFTRRTKYLLSELDQPFQYAEERFWMRRDGYLSINPTGMVPTLLRRDQVPIYDSLVISDYLLDKHFLDNSPESSLIPSNDKDYLTIKRICVWLDSLTFSEVTQPLLMEKVVNCFKSSSAPDANILSAARYNLNIHLEYIDYCISRTGYMHGERFTLADLAASSQISVIDYLHEVKWSKYPRVKTWYSVIKSKPHFRAILKERIRGYDPPSFYEDPDF